MPFTTLLALRTPRAVECFGRPGGPAAGLEAVARAFAKIIDQVNTLDLAALQPTPMRSSR